MADGFVSDPDQLKALATTLFRLRGQYDGINVTTQTTNEDFGSWEVEGGVAGWRTKWTQKRPAVGALVHQLA